LGQVSPERAGSQWTAEPAAKIEYRSVVAHADVGVFQPSEIAAHMPWSGARECGANQWCWWFCRCARSSKSISIDTDTRTLRPMSHRQEVPRC